MSDLEIYWKVLPMLEITKLNYIFLYLLLSNLCLNLFRTELLASAMTPVLDKIPHRAPILEVRVKN